MKPSFLGTKVFDDYPLADLRDYIDWTPFFQSWDLHGTYPAILTDNVVGEAARNLFDDAQAMLDQMIAEKWLTCKAVIGFWPAARDGDDIVLYEDDTRTAEKARLHSLRQQMEKREGRHNFALADFIAPSEIAPDYIGGFAVTAGHGEDEVAQNLKRLAMIIARLCQKRLLTVLLKRLPSACTSLCAPNIGAMRLMSSLIMTR